MKKAKKGGILSEVGTRSLTETHNHTAVYLEAMDSCSCLVKSGFHMIVPNRPGPQSFQIMFRGDRDDYMETLAKR